jgi:hypothetical protein
MKRLAEILIIVMVASSIAYVITGYKIFIILMLGALLGGIAYFIVDIENKSRR